MNRTRRKWTNILITILSVLFLTQCAPANNFSGTWTTNIGKVIFSQDGNTVTGMIQGYGGNWNESFQGTIAGKEASFKTTWFGDFTLVLGGNTFKTKSAELSFCGIQSVVTQELPKGCGFSGKWNLKTNIYPAGSYMILTQIAETVTGDVYDKTNQIIDNISGAVSWGKGWRMEGQSTNHGPVTLNIAADETGIDIVFGSAGSDQQCAVRDVLQSAYLFYYTCQP